MILLYGAGGHGVVVSDILKCQGISDVVFVDDAPEAKIQGYSVIQASEIQQYDYSGMIITVGLNRTRKKIAHSIKLPFLNAFHPKAAISEINIQIEYGTVIMANVVINPRVQIGAHSIINSGAVVEHDCQLGRFTHLGPNATLCGGVLLGDGCFVGSGAVVLPGISIGAWSTIGAGAVVTKDIPEHCTAVGAPAVPIKFHR